ncbi:MAG: glycosyltransferase family 2 protein [Planctomycetota bacterium]
MKTKNRSNGEGHSYETPVRNGIRQVELSFVIPVYNEEETLDELTSRILEHVPDPEAIEIIFIDDGSTDDSWMVIEALADVHEVVRGIKFRGNRGKAAGLQAGFDAAVGNIVFTMDADLQDDPQEIPRFLDKIEDGYDLVSGWKKVRHDPWHKVLPSRIFNRMLSYCSGVHLHDHNCGFKCYRSEVTKTVKLYGELHRMVPSLAGMEGFRVSEIPVQHHARQHGKSKYGIERFIRGFSDMLTIGFLRKYKERPSHFANTWAAGYMSIGSVLVLTGVICGAALVKGLVLILTGLVFLAIAAVTTTSGLFCELLVRKNVEVQAALPEIAQTVGDVNALTLPMTDVRGGRTAKV